MGFIKNIKGLTPRKLGGQYLMRQRLSSSGLKKHQA